MCHTSTTCWLKSLKRAPLHSTSSKKGREGTRVKFCHFTPLPQISLPIMAGMPFMALPSTPDKRAKTNVQHRFVQFFLLSFSSLLFTLS